jgi:hypothetical protein
VECSSVSHEIALNKRVFSSTQSHYATGWKVAVSRPDKVIEMYQFA